MTEAVDKGYNKIKFQKYDIHGILSKSTPPRRRTSTHTIPALTSATRTAARH
jgi:hypothetical protein